MIARPRINDNVILVLYTYTYTSDFPEQGSGPTSGARGHGMAALGYLAVAVLVLAAIFELPHHMPRAQLVSCRMAGVADPGLCVASPLPAASSWGWLPQVLLHDEEPELEYFACSELHRSLPCALPTRHEHAGRNCFNKRPKNSLLRLASAEGGSGPGGRDWEWQPKVGEYIDGDAEDQEAQLTFTMSTAASEHGQQPGDSAYRWQRAPAWASMWHKPWAKVKLTLGNEDGGSSEMEATHSAVGCASI